MRIAWTGASVGAIESGSVAVLAGQLMTGLLENGIDVDFYLAGDPEVIPPELREHPGLSIENERVNWQWGRWYSRWRPLAFVSSLVARAFAQVKLSLRLIRNHRRRRYDCVFQFSQTELLLLGPAARWLPPIVVQPSTTAAGELAWHRRESTYARRHEKALSHFIARGFLSMRTAVQRRQLRHTRFVVAASEVFRHNVEREYGLPPSQTRVLPHPTDVDFYSPVTRPVRGDAPLVLLFAARLSARKGLELVVDLSHRLDDLAGQVEIHILGGISMWSDYSGHLADLNPRVAKVARPRQAKEMRDVYEGVDIVLAPSHYEPFSLVTAEALAAGVPVVASDQIGAAEGVDHRVCRVFASGDVDAFEKDVRALMADLRAHGGPAELAAIAREEARRLFAPDLAGTRLVAILREAAATA